MKQLFLKFAGRSTQFDRARIRFQARPEVDRYDRLGGYSLSR